MADSGKLNALARGVKIMDKRSGRRSSGGFTLVELMITLVLMAILLGIGVGILHGMHDHLFLPRQGTWPQPSLHSALIDNTAPWTQVVTI